MEYNEDSSSERRRQRLLSGLIDLTAFVDSVVCAETPIETSFPDPINIPFLFTSGNSAES